MSRNNKYYDEDDMYDYDDDEDYAPPKPKNNPKANANANANNTATKGKGTLTQTKQSSTSTLKSNTKMTATTNSINAIKTANTSNAINDSVLNKTSNLPPAHSAGINHETDSTSSIFQKSISLGSTINVTTSITNANINYNDFSDDDCDTDESIHKERVNTNNKQNITIIVTGHVDAGKSTLIGHLLYNNGDVTQKEIHKNEKKSNEIGKGSFALAWVMDETQSERERGVTIDIAERYISTSDHNITLIDSPGHSDFVPAMISGAHQADAAILVLPATEGEFESSMKPQAQTYEHAQLLQAFGIKHVIVAVNKMDNTQPEPWSQERFQYITQSILNLLVGTLKFDEKYIYIIPVSGLKGTNLIPKKLNTSHSNDDNNSGMDWYKGLSLLEYMNNISSSESIYSNSKMSNSNSNSNSSKSMNTFRAVITSINLHHTSHHTSFEINAVILRGRIRITKHIGIAGKCICEIKKIVNNRNMSTMETATVGDHVIMILVEKNERNPNELRLQVGDCLFKGISLPPHITNKFQGNICIAPVIPRPILPGTIFEMYIHGIVLECHIAKIVNIVPSSLTELLEQAEKISLGIGKYKCIPANCTATVQIIMNQNIALELFHHFQPFGRFVLRSLGKTIATGTVTHIGV